MEFLRFFLEPKKISFLFFWKKNCTKADDTIYFIYKCEPACFLSMHMHNNCFVKAKYTEMEKKPLSYIREVVGLYPKLGFLEVVIREMGL